MPFDGTGFEIAPTPQTVEPVTEPWRQVLLDAADYIEAHGLSKGRLCNSDGQRCAVGAIYKAEPSECWTGDPDARRAHSEMTRFIYARSKRAISSWNNQQERTASEVTSALRACARS